MPPSWGMLVPHTNKCCFGNNWATIPFILTTSSCCFLSFLLPFGGNHSTPPKDKCLTYVVSWSVVIVPSQHMKGLLTDCLLCFLWTSVPVMVEGLRTSFHGEDCFPPFPAYLPIHEGTTISCLAIFCSQWGDLPSHCVSVDYYHFQNTGKRVTC